MKKVVFDNTVVEGDEIQLHSQDGETTVVIEVKEANHKGARGPALRLVIKNS
jgi:formylmethanofuran dehydrogenase subunit D